MLKRRDAIRRLWGRRSDPKVRRAIHLYVADLRCIRDAYRVRR